MLKGSGTYTESTINGKRDFEVRFPELSLMGTSPEQAVLTLHWAERSTDGNARSTASSIVLSRWMSERFEQCRGLAENVSDAVFLGTERAEGRH